MRNPLLVLALGIALAAPVGRGLQAQGDPQIGVSTVELNQGGIGAAVVSGGLLLDSKTRELLRSGFATEIRYRLESWREAGWFDDLDGSTEWIVLVSYDPTTQLYRVVRRHGNQFEDFGGFVTADAADAAVSRPYVVPLRARDRGRRYYYSVAVEVQTLSVTDLDELQRWLRGEFQPAVRGKNSVVNAVKTGVGTLLSRLLGGEKRRYERRSSTYIAP